LDDQSDFSGSLRIPNEPEDEAKEARSVFQEQVQIFYQKFSSLESFYNFF
jgi:hypothetical protein